MSDVLRVPVPEARSPMHRHCWTYVPCGEVVFHVLPDEQITPFLREHLLAEWQQDAREFPDQPWTRQWIDDLSRRRFRLQVVRLDMVRCRCDLMDYRGSAYCFADELASRADEMQRAVLGGCSLEPIVVKADGFELMDGYCRTEVLRRLGCARALSYVGRAPGSRIEDS